MGNTPDLDAIRARAEAATKGPWRVGARREADHDRWHVPIVYDCPVAEDETVEDDLATVNYLTGGFQYPHGDAKADAEFIAHARTDVPALLGEIDRLTRENASLRRTVVDLAKTGDDALDELAQRPLPSPCICVGPMGSVQCVVHGIRPVVRCGQSAAQPLVIEEVEAAELREEDTNEYPGRTDVDG